MGIQTYAAKLMELVAEIGPANGDIGYALDVVRAAKESGFSAVKAQIYDRDMLVTPTAKTYAHDIAVPETQYEDFANQLTYPEWERVKAECDDIGIEFFASCFDNGALHFAEALGVKRFKIASGDITYEQLIRAASYTGREVILSTGAATGPEIARALTWVSGPVVVLACTLSYPCRDEDANLARMGSIREVLYRSGRGAMVDTDVTGSYRILNIPGWPVGYSDHTFGVGAMIRAYQLGAEMVEKHFTITPGAGGDHDFAVTPEQMQVFWEYKDKPSGNIYDGSPELGPTESEMKARHGARRSLHAGRDLQSGNMLRSNDVKFLRPADGLEPWQLDDYLGRPLKRDIPAGQAIRAEVF